MIMMVQQEGEVKSCYHVLGLDTLTSTRPWCRHYGKNISQWGPGHHKIDDDFVSHGLASVYCCNFTLDILNIHNLGQNMLRQILV